MLELQFWGATGEVTGSCYLLRVGERRILIDCGLIQGSPEEEARNREPLPFEPREIDAVILTHAHIDHSGRLPLLVRSGFRGPIYTHYATRDLCRIMLNDSARINEKEAKIASRQERGQTTVEPLYTVHDAERAMDAFHPLSYDERQEILPGVELRLRDAGHILGASIVELWLQLGEERRKLVFSGDLGHRNAPVMRDPTTISEADLVVMESTYGDRNHPSWQNSWDELATILQQADADRGNLLIPSFAVGRTQDLLYAFTRHYEDWGLGRWSVFLDSPLATRVTELYSHHVDLYDAEAQACWRQSDSPFLLPNLHVSRTAEQSIAINQIHSGALIIAGSGMCDGGRIRHHLMHNAWRRECHIAMVGFQVEETLGRALVDGARYIPLGDSEVEVAATVHTIAGLSAHADQQELLQWYRAFTKRPPIALVHGEEEARQELQQKLDTLQAKVYTPRHGEVLDLLKIHN